MDADGNSVGNDNGRGSGSGCGRGALLVMNQLQLLPQCDLVIFMENGTAVAQGTYEHLLDSSSSFAEYAATYQQRHAAGEGDNEDEGRGGQEVSLVRTALEMDEGGRGTVITNRK